MNNTRKKLPFEDSAVHNFVVKKKYFTVPLSSLFELTPHRLKPSLERQSLTT